MVAPASMTPASLSHRLDYPFEIDRKSTPGATMATTTVSDQDLVSRAIAAGLAGDGVITLPPGVLTLDEPIEVDASNLKIRCSNVAVGGRTEIAAAVRIPAGLIEPLGAGDPLYSRIPSGVRTSTWVIDAGAIPLFSGPSAGQEYQDIAAIHLGLFHCRKRLQIASLLGGENVWGLMQSAGASGLQFIAAVPHDSTAQSKFAALGSTDLAGLLCEFYGHGQDNQSSSNQVESVNAGTRAITLVNAPPAGYSFEGLSTGKHRRYRLYNLAEFLHLDSWIYEPAENRIYICLATAPGEIHISRPDGNALTIRGSNIQMDGVGCSFTYGNGALTIEDQSSSSTFNDVVVRRGRFRGNLGMALLSRRLRDVQVLECSFEDAEGGGYWDEFRAGASLGTMTGPYGYSTSTPAHNVALSPKTDILVEGCRFTGLGLRNPQRNRAVMVGFTSRASQCVVKRNYFDSCGGWGVINFGVAGAIVDNRLSRMCQKLSDAAAIYTGAQKLAPVIMRGNTITDMVHWSASATSVTPGQTSVSETAAPSVYFGRGLSFISGIFLDDAVFLALVDGNTVTNAPVGLLCNYGMKNVITGNRFDSIKAQPFYLAGPPSNGASWTNNAKFLAELDIFVIAARQITTAGGRLDGPEWSRYLIDPAWVQAAVSAIASGNPANAAAANAIFESLGWRDAVTDNSITDVRIYGNTVTNSASQPAFPSGYMVAPIDVSHVLANVPDVQAKHPVRAGWEWA